MCCITFVAQASPMATTQFMRAAGHEGRSTRQGARMEVRPVRLNWVVVTGEDQKRQLQMNWKPSAGNR